MVTYLTRHLTTGVVERASAPARVNSAGQQRVGKISVTGRNQPKPARRPTKVKMGASEWAVACARSKLGEAIALGTPWIIDFRLKQLTKVQALPRIRGDWHPRLRLRQIEDAIAKAYLSGDDASVARHIREHARERRAMIQRGDFRL
jgi:hypothetical protein